MNTKPFSSPGGYARGVAAGLRQGLRLRAEAFRPRIERWAERARQSDAVDLAYLAGVAVVLALAAYLLIVG